MSLEDGKKALVKWDLARKEWEREYREAKNQTDASAYSIKSAMDSLTDLESSSIPPSLAIFPS